MIQDLLRTLCDPTDCSLPGPLCMGFSRQASWSGLSCPPPGVLPDPGIEPASLKSAALAGQWVTTSTTWEARILPTYVLTGFGSVCGYHKSINCLVRPFENCHPDQTYYSHSLPKWKIIQVAIYGPFLENSPALWKSIATQAFQEVLEVHPDQVRSWLMQKFTISRMPKF